MQFRRVFRRNPRVFVFMFDKKICRSFPSNFEESLFPKSEATWRHVTLNKSSWAQTTPDTIPWLQILMKCHNPPDNKALQKVWQHTRLLFQAKSSLETLVQNENLNTCEYPCLPTRLNELNGSYRPFAPCTVSKVDVIKLEKHFYYHN